MKKPQTIEELRKEIKNGKTFDKDGTPVCPICWTEMTNAVDSKTKKISKYLWKTTCEHSKGIILSWG